MRFHSHAAWLNASRVSVLVLVVLLVLSGCRSVDNEDAVSVVDSVAEGEVPQKVPSSSFAGESTATSLPMSTITALPAVTITPVSESMNVSGSGPDPEPVSEPETGNMTNESELTPQPDPSAAARLGTGYVVTAEGVSVDESVSIGEGGRVPAVNLRSLSQMSDGSYTVQLEPVGEVPYGTQVCQWATAPATAELNGVPVVFLHVHILSQVPQPAEDGEYRLFEGWDVWIAENLLVPDSTVECP